MWVKRPFPLPCFSDELKWGDRSRIEPSFYEDIKNKAMASKILKDGGVTPYLEKLHGHDLEITRDFVNG